MITAETPKWKIATFITVSLLFLFIILFGVVYSLARLDTLSVGEEEFTLPVSTEIQTDPLVSPTGPLLPPIEEIDPVLGSLDAPVVIIYFADFTCPFCSEMHSVWQQVLSEYGDDVTIVWKDLLIYESSLGLHKGGRCAQLQGAFWPYYDRIWDYDFQGQSTSVGLINLAAELNLDTDFFAKCIASTDIENVVFGAARQSLSAGIGEAPSYFINDQFYTGFQDITEIRAIINAELGQ